MFFYYIFLLFFLVTPIYSFTSTTTRKKTLSTTTTSTITTTTTTTTTSYLSFLLIGDWGGSGVPPYYTPGEEMTAYSMSIIASQTNAQFVIALGDNFYALGLCNNNTLAPYNNTCPNATNPTTGTMYDQRFFSTFENVFTQSSLQIPWYLLAGNHDALGNVSAAIAYSSISPRWKWPNYWYSVKQDIGNNNNEYMELIMLDSTLCYGIWSDSYHEALCAAQLAWFIEQLENSKAHYLLVALHYPAYSACSHGNTLWTIGTILPLAYKYNVTALLAGHDHCQEFIAPPDTGNDLVHIITGTGDGCCYTETNIGNVPNNSLKFLMSSGYNPTNAIGGFTLAQYTDNGLIFTFYNANTSILFTTPILLPRTIINNNTVLAPNYHENGRLRPSEELPHMIYTNKNEISTEFPFFASLSV